MLNAVPLPNANPCSYIAGQVWRLKCSTVTLEMVSGAINNRGVSQTANAVSCPGTGPGRTVLRM